MMVRNGVGKNSKVGKGSGGANEQSINVAASYSEQHCPHFLPALWIVSPRVLFYGFGR